MTSKSWGRAHDDRSHERDPAEGAHRCRRGRIPHLVTMRDALPPKLISGELRVKGVERFVVDAVS